MLAKKSFIGSATAALMFLTTNNEIFNTYILLTPTRKKVAFVFFVVKSLSNLGKIMSITKLLGKIGFEIFPDFEVL